MFSEPIFHPVSGEKGYFISEKDIALIRAIVNDFQQTKLDVVMGDAE